MNNSLFHTFVSGFIILIFVLVFSIFFYNGYQVVVNGKDICETTMVRYASIQDVPYECLKRDMNR